MPLLVAGCTPIGEPAREDAATGQTGSLGRGDTLPDFALLTADGRALSRAQLQGRVAVLSFVPPGSADVGDASSRILERIAGLQAGLSRLNATDVDVVVLVLAPGSAASELVREALAGTLSMRPAIVVQEPAEAVAGLAKSLGAVWIADGPSGPTPSFMTVVIDRQGRIADLFPGVRGWSDADLLAAVQATRSR